MFPLKNIEYSMNTRKTEEYHVNMAKTDRHKNSAIPYVQSAKVTQQEHVEMKTLTQVRN